MPYCRARVLIGEAGTQTAMSVTLNFIPNLGALLPLQQVSVSQPSRTMLELTPLGGATISNTQEDQAAGRPAGGKE